ncbi:MAG: glucuronate isomerase [Clostridiales bacterium]|nr:glucuronate isomerase [Clostridiales bacterium]
MQPFMNDDFLLNTETARRLYHEHAAKMPIIDYHCHIPPQEIADDKQYDNITRLWLGGDHFGDHYKWRLIRSNGVDENLITGDAPDRERFQAFAEMLPRAIGNPMYHWTHLELKRFFGYDGVLNGDTAEEVWNLCNEKLKTLTVREMIRMANVDMVGTTDDPVDSLEAHARIKNDPTITTKVLPSWRPDKALNIHKEGFAEYIHKLSQVSGVEIDSVCALQEALKKRLDHFDEMGCRASDHGLDKIPYADLNEWDVEAIFSKGLAGEKVTDQEAEAFQFAMMLFLGREYARRGWAMQMHYGAVRNTNTRRFAELGPDTGYDCIGSTGDAKSIAAFMNAFEKTGELPKTILYSLNGADNAMLVTIAQSFQSNECRGKVQHGSAWWHNDTFEGMVQQIKELAERGLLGNFIGMLTDSRSFLSYTRHEYFRRIVCRVIGQWVEDGMYPADMDTLGKIVEDISYYNAKEYFNL